MGLRIHFTVEDLARTRVDPAPRPLLELSIALRLLQTRDHPLRYGAWRREVAARLPVGARRVVELVPVQGWAPDFVAPCDAGDVEALIDKLRSTPRRQIVAELAEIAEQQTMPTWSGRLADEPEAMRTFLDTLLGVHQTVLATWWPRLRSRVLADQAVRARMMAGGMEVLLSGLSPRLRWRAPVLEMLGPCDGDLHLDGRGLLLVPTALGGTLPVIAPTAEPQPVLAYAAADPDPLHDLLVLAPRSSNGPGRAVAALLGRTRAAVLYAIATHPGCTTKELAAHCRIAPASASEHATTLRAAELISTSRHRNTVLHTPTTLGLALLDTITDEPNVV
ncbi:MarR family transcriptional regulator [Streptomyces sp. NPDC012769]|uniref:MarR family transcriptional regulator n=1 Tax=Streptomyces sp. NPDC012769 TaxID=3364848 RepID=UPI0036813D66